MQALEQLPSAPLATPPAMSEGVRVLVVEDSKSEQMRLQALISALGYEVLVANDGEGALEQMCNQRIDLIVSDWRMPRMNGIELCRIVRAEEQFQPYIILVTGQNTKSDLVAGMDAGADDFISKPFASEELRVRLQAGVRVLQLRHDSEQRSIELARALQREEQANQSIREDLRLAAKMQREFLPAPISPFPQLEIGGLFQAASQVAGDSYNFFALDPDHLAFYLIDVAGHGVAAAMQSFALSRLLSPEMEAFKRAPGNETPNEARQLPPAIADPSAVVATLNERFSRNDECRHYFTMICGVLNVDTGRGRLCQAGHPHPLIMEGPRRMRRLGNGGFAVGMLQEADYEDIDFCLAPGERLVIYSDGVTDCSDPAGERIGLQGFANMIGRFQAQPVPTLIEGIDNCLQTWRGGQDNEDDVSVLTIGRKPT